MAMGSIGSLVINSFTSVAMERWLLLALLIVPLALLGIVTLVSPRD